MDVYLDQKDWIGLARALHGKDADVTAKLLLQRANQAVNRGRARFPISRVHLLEAMKMGDNERRKRLIQAFLYFSRGWVVKPAESVIAEELASWGRGEPARLASVVRRGLLAAMGDYEAASRRLGVSAAEIELEDQLGDAPSAWYFALARPEFASSAAQVHAIAQRHVETVESVRREWSELSSLERLAVYAKGVLDDIQVTLTPVPTEVQVAIDKLLALDPADLVAAVRELPTLDVMVRLGEAKARDRSHPTTPNDLWDLAFLALAIPYFQVVVTEKFWAHLATSLGLNTQYSCRVLAKLPDLIPHLQ